MLATYRARYKVVYGGRGSGKSWTVARMLLLLGRDEPLRILCVREIQNNIKQSVHKLLCDQIYNMGLEDFYRITDHSITGINGTQFIFAGLWQNTRGIKSLEGINICWIEEGEAITKKSWEDLDPTIRGEKVSGMFQDSEIWITYNPRHEKDCIHNMFCVQEPPENSLIIEMNYQDNPWFPKALDEIRIHAQNTDIDLYNHVWLGQCEQHSHAQIFKGKWVVQNFKSPDENRVVFYHGLDWGSGAQGDPTVIVRCFVNKNKLYIDKASFIYDADTNDLPMWLRETCPTTNEYTIWTDHNEGFARKYLKKDGFDVRRAYKGAGSIKQGIRYLRSFDEIIIHTSLTEMIEEAENYKRKIDPMTDEVLPIIIDKYNHGWDAIRYATAPMAKRGINHTKE